MESSPHPGPKRSGFARGNRCFASGLRSCARPTWIAGKLVTGLRFLDAGTLAQMSAPARNAAFSPAGRATSLKLPSMTSRLFGLTLLSMAASACLSVPKNPPAAATQNPSSAAANDTAPTTADEVLARYVAAIGGEAALAKQRQRVTEAELTFFPHEGCQDGEPGCLSQKLQGKFISYNTDDGRMYRRTVVADRVEERGFSGHESWTLRTDPQWLILEPKDKIDQARENARLHWYLGYKKRGRTPVLLPARQVERATGQGGKEQVWLDGIAWKEDQKLPEAQQFWFERSTGLLVEETERQSAEASPEGIASEQLLTYDAYRAVDGVLIPHIITQVTKAGPRNTKIEVRIASVKHGAIDEKRYALPEVKAPQKVADPVLAGMVQAQQAAAKEPKDKNAAIEWARRSFAAADFDQAQSAALKALKLERNEPEAQFILGQIDGLRGELKSQSKRLKAAAKAGAGPQPLAYLEAWSALESGDFKKVAQGLEAAGLSAMAARYQSLVEHPTKVSGGCSAQVMLQPAGVPAIEIQVKNQSVDKTLVMMIDTSASDALLPKSLAQSLMVMPEGQAPLAVGGNTAPYGRIENIQIGAVKLSNLPVSIIPDEAMQQFGGPDKIDGVIGTRFLMNFLLRIDPQGQKATLVSARRSCRSKARALGRGIAVPLMLHEARYIFMPGAIGEHPGVYMLNTGLRGAVMMGNLRAFAIAGIAAPTIRSNEMPMVKLPSFSLLGKSGSKPQMHTLSGIPAAFGLLQDEWTGAGFRLDGMAGAWVFGARAWTLDIAGRKIWIDEGPKK